MSFECPACSEVYRDHWKTLGRPACRTCTAEIRGECEFEDHPEHLTGHPCSYGSEKPGEPCRYCARPFPEDGSPCPKCWLSLESLPLADIKAVFAEDGTFDITPIRRPS